MRVDPAMSAAGDDFGGDGGFGAEEGEGGGGGVELGVRGGAEELGFVEGEDGGAVEVGDHNAPVGAGDGGGGEDGLDLLGERGLRGAWREGQREDGCAEEGLGSHGRSLASGVG